MRTDNYGNGDKISNHMTNVDFENYGVGIDNDIYKYNLDDMINEISQEVGVIPDSVYDIVKRDYLNSKGHIDTINDNLCADSFGTIFCSDEYREELLSEAKNVFKYTKGQSCKN